MGLPAPTTIWPLSYFKGSVNPDKMLLIILFFAFQVLKKMPPTIGIKGRGITFKLKTVLKLV